MAGQLQPVTRSDATKQPGPYDEEIRSRVYSVRSLLVGQARNPTKAKVEAINETRRAT